MQPDQQPSPDYNFIVNNTPQKKRLFSGGGSQKQRIMIVAAGAGLLLVIFGIIFSLIFNSGKSGVDSLAALAADQTEIIRIADIGEKKAASTDTKNFASTTKLSMASAHKQLASYLSERGRKLSAKDLAASKNAILEEKLTAAEQANQFDEVFETELEQLVIRYHRQLSKLYESSGSTPEKNALQGVYFQTRKLETAAN